MPIGVFASEPSDLISRIIAGHSHYERILRVLLGGLCEPMNAVFMLGAHIHQLAMTLVFLGGARWYSPLQDLGSRMKQATNVIVHCCAKCWPSCRRR
jgi:hypothetical protein